MDKFENYEIDKIVINEVYKRDSTIPTPPYINDNCAELSDDGIQNLKQRIVSALGKKSTSLMMDIEDDGEASVFHALKTYFNSDKTDDDVLEMAKDVTYQLHEAQNLKTIQGGVVVVITGTVQESGKQCVAIIKAEKQSGFSLADADGEKVLQFYNDLLLTKNQKFHKIGFFINNAVRGRQISKSDIDAFVFDSNNDMSVTAGKAIYFYSDFLGLTFRRDSNILTKEFFEQTRTYINTKDNIDGIRKVELCSALLAYVKSPAPNLNVAEFANANFVPEIVDDYVRFMETKSIPTNSIRKDLSFVNASLKKRKVHFDNSIVIQAPVDDFEEMIDVTENEEGNTVVTIKGKVVRER